MNLTIDTRDVTALRDRFATFSDRRFAAGMATALTRAAGTVRTAERAEIADVFDRPKPYTLGAVYTRPATAQKLEAVVGIRDQASEGRPPSKWLHWQIFGGLRRLTAWEKQLVRGGAMDSGDRAVPGRFARLDAYGNISPGQLQQIFSQLRIETNRLGSARTLPRLGFADTGAQRRATLGKINRAYRRAGGEFIAFPYGRGKLRPGLYLIRPTAFGRADPKPVLIFVSKAEYQKRFDFFYAGQVAAARALPVEVGIALGQQLQRLQARPA